MSQNLFKWKQFEKEIILLCVRWYLKMTKYLNKIIEQDHRFIKRKVRSMLGFGSFESEEKTIAGIEAIHMIRKGQVEEVQCILSEIQLINEILGATA